MQENRGKYYVMVESKFPAFMKTKITNTNNDGFVLYPDMEMGVCVLTANF
jgi:hypothetical protein